MAINAKNQVGAIDIIVLLGITSLSKTDFQLKHI